MDRAEWHLPRVRQGFQVLLRRIFLALIEQQHCMLCSPSGGANEFLGTGSMTYA